MFKSVLHHFSRRLAFLAALLYSVFGVVIEKARGAEDDINTVAAGTLTGMLFKSASKWINFKNFNHQFRASPLLSLPLFRRRRPEGRRPWRSGRFSLVWCLRHLQQLGSPHWFTPILQTLLSPPSHFLLHSGQISPGHSL